MCSSDLEGASSAHAALFWTSTKEEMCARNRCGCTNLFKQTVSVEICSYKSIRKVRKLTCVREATTLQGRNDYARFWRKSTYCAWGSQAREELVSYFEPSTDVRRSLIKMSGKVMPSI